MAQLGGMLAAAILKVVGDQIGSAIAGRIKLHKDFTKDLEKMKMALESVEAVLDDAERRSITDKSTRLWLKRLKDAMYAIADMIDEFESDSEAITKPSARKFSLKRSLGVVIPCLTICRKITIAKKMEKMREELEVITDQHKKFELSTRGYTNELKAIDIRETSSIMDTEVIVGRTEETEKILFSLSESMTKEITVLPIYGIGGLGKTTLAKIVYNSSQFKDYSRVWVYVSQTFDLKKIGNSIISQLSETVSQQPDLQTIQNSLSKLLAGKKILIVLDDLWEDNQSQLASLKAMIKVGNERKMAVVVTTRAEGIAQKISTIQPHKLEPLTDGMSWSIIKQKSAFESRGDKEHLEHIGMDIAVKCGGVALAAQSLGHMLHSLASSEWESVRNSDMWNISTLEDTSSTHVLASLRLSYSVMHPYLKLCFAYCAIFPKGHKIVKDDLIHQWISHGFIEPTNVFSFWQLGERYIRQLLGLSFLQDSKSSLTAELYHEDFTLLTMHDLVHDLARSVMLDEILVAGKHGNTGGCCYRYALLNDCSKPLDSSKIRALSFMDCGQIDLHDAAFSSAKSLRVLDLSACSIHKLPDSIGLLKQLRYLNAPRVQHEVVPDSITKLSKLIYLNLQGSYQIKDLPQSIGDIKGLMYLDLSGCSGIINLPESFGELKNVVHLDLSNCSLLKGVSLFLGRLKKLNYLDLSYCKYIGELPEALGDLSELKYLDLSSSSYLECQREAQFLGSLSKLEHLNLSSDNFHLKKLPEAIGNFLKLKYLNLSSSMGYGSWGYITNCVLEDSVDSFMCSITTLFNLEHLDLSHNEFITSIPRSIGNLRKLHTLNLSYCRELLKIPESIATIETLKILYTVGCPNLLLVPKLSSNSVSLPYFMVHACDGEPSSNLVLLRHTDPVVLQIAGLENVKTAEEAQSIGLIGKQSMKKLMLEWTRYAERSVDDKLLLEKLVPPSTVQDFQILGYNSVSFPAWLLDVTHYLPDLVRVTLWDIPNCKVLPPMDKLPNLNNLVLKDMASLEEWNTSYSSGQERSIDSVEIHDCPKLRITPLPPRTKQLEIINSDYVLSSWGEYRGASTTSSYPVKTTLGIRGCTVPMHQWRLLQHLPGLDSLRIRSSIDLTGSPEVIQHLSSLSSLMIKKQQEIPKWVGELTSLHELKISECSGLIELHENMRQLTELHSLKLVHCNSIASLPYWLGELTSLEKLAIWRCDLIGFLPEGIQQLTNLKELDIYCCPALRKWCETEEEIMKPTPKQKRACVLPTSLEKLRIYGCDGISSLPEGIEQLTNLQELHIRLCPALTKWCELEENATKLAHIAYKTIRVF